MQEKMSEKQAVAYMESLKGYGMVAGLDSIRRLCSKLGNPQEELFFVHIAGTNGKGSVSAFVSSILKAAGYRTGRYLSPVLQDYRERFEYNGRMISRADFCECVSQVKEGAESLVREGEPHPTQFEMDTAAAFLFFRKKRCELVVLETGMGGRLDATNLINNTVVAAITPVSMDHVQFLGNTLEKIGTEKAGIIKKGCRVVSAWQSEEVRRILDDTCHEKDCRIRYVHPEGIRTVVYGLERQRFTYGQYRNLVIRMGGNYQVENGALAVAVIEELSAAGYPVEERSLREGLEQAVWKGRFQIISRKPYFIVDGAHNAAGAVRLAECLEYYFTNKKIIYIMGILRDKDHEGIIKASCHLADQVITCTPRNTDRAMHAYDLAREVSKYHNSVTAADSLEEATELACLLADKESVITAFGSLSYLGDMIDIVGKKSGSRRDLHDKQRQGKRRG